MFFVYIETLPRVCVWRERARVFLLVLFLLSPSERPETGRRALPVSCVLCVVNKRPHQGLFHFSAPFAEGTHNTRTHSTEIFSTCFAHACARVFHFVCVFVLRSCRPDVLRAAAPSSCACTGVSNLSNTRLSIDLKQSLVIMFKFILWRCRLAMKKSEGGTGRTTALPAHTRSKSFAKRAHTKALNIQLPPHLSETNLLFLSNNFDDKTGQMATITARPTGAAALAKARRGVAPRVAFTSVTAQAQKPAVPTPAAAATPARASVVSQVRTGLGRSSTKNQVPP
jgi:hypothetical protein